MEKLLTSRTKRDEELMSLGNLSPQKYGRSAFCNLQYTPSKLVDHVLYKQVNTLKKIQQQSSKTREYEAINDCLMEKLGYLEQQKSVIINSLNQQIVVYKKIIKQMQSKNEQRIKELQRKFKQQLNKILSSKQEQVKFVQSQRQILQGRIEELQNLNKQLQHKIDYHDRNVSDLKNNYQKLQKDVQNLNYKIKEKSKQIQQLEDNNRLEVQNLKRKFLDSQMTWKQELKQAYSRKQIEISAVQNGYRQQIEKIQELRSLQEKSFKSESSQLIHSYQKQLKKISQLLVSKQRTIQTLSYDHRQEKNKNIGLMRKYETQLSEINNVKLLVGQLEQQNKKLRDLLIQSSRQLQRCRQQFLQLDRENNMLKLKVKSADEQARTWRDSYYMGKRN